MQTQDPALGAALRSIDAANAKDPNLEVNAETGQQQPKELLYGQRMTEQLAEFCPEASVHLQIAARAQHIERWTSPRSAYPEGRAGYKKWRSELSLFHANRAAEVMSECGFNEKDCERVKFLIQKRQLRRDPETQTLEDVVCLVFLKHYLEDFANKHAEDKLIDIIQKTWNKMSESGHQAALALPYKPHLGTLINKALS